MKTRNPCAVGKQLWRNVEEVSLLRFLPCKVKFLVLRLSDVPKYCVFQGLGGIFFSCALIVNITLNF